MPTRVTCACGNCRKCKHRAYMRDWYHRRDWRGKTYLAAGSGGHVVLDCSHCGGQFETTARKHEGHERRFCSRACKDAARCAAERQAREQGKAERSCRHCGAEMPRGMRADARYCSARCNSRAHALTRKASRRIGARQEGIDRASIIERDGSLCHICEQVVPEALITIDHIVPLAEGGTHSADNLAIACMPCNCRKGARSVAYARTRLKGT